MDGFCRRLRVGFYRSGNVKTPVWQVVHVYVRFGNHTGLQCNAEPTAAKADLQTVGIIILTFRSWPDADKLSYPRVDNHCFRAQVLRSMTP